MSESEKKQKTEGTVTESEIVVSEKDTQSSPETDNSDKKGMKMPNLKDAGKKMPVGPGNFWNNVLSTVLLLIFITAAYSYVSDTTQEPEELSISDIVTQVQSGEVKEIVVRGSQLEVNYLEEGRNAGEAKKESGTAISETLTNFGVTPEQLSSVEIDVQNETGFAYWLGNVAPFIFPLIFLGVIIWFFTRSVKGAGMQAMSFGY